MVFTSTPFVIFFIVFFILYWIFLNKRPYYQNLLLLLGSYFFYAWADWRFLALLIGISALNFLLGIYIEKAEQARTKRTLLIVGLIQGVGGLVAFKYFDFFIDSFNVVFNSLYLKIGLKTLNWVTPLGISFFTFKTMSYILDIYNNKIKATKNWLLFFIYISFFPTILSGPIDKARTFIPQLLKEKHFSYDQAVEGLRQILWGLFKKSVIADNCATGTDLVFNNYASQPASSLAMAALLYSFQIYADFSGYSDMAIGIGKLLGFNVTKNFDYPFFAQNVAEFWRKWHMSLTSWLTEYVFTPLSISFRNFGEWGLIMAIVINLTICGMWHGANWTYVLYGFLHGCYFIPLILTGSMYKKKKIAIGKIFPSPKEALNIIGTFTLITFTFILFRSNNIHEALGFYKGLFSKTLFVISSGYFKQMLMSLFFIIIMMVIEWFARNKDFGISELQKSFSRPIRWSVYTLLFILILVFGADTHQFVYVRF